MPTTAEATDRSRCLGDAIQIKRGISWDRSMERYVRQPGTWPVLRTGNIRENLVLNELTYLAGISAERAARFAAARGWTILVASNGNARRVGSPVFIEENRGFLFASFLLAVAPKPRSCLEPKFLYYYLRTPRVRQAISDSVRGTTGLKNLSRGVLCNLPCPTHTLAQQRCVVQTLDAVEQIIHTTERLTAKLEAVRSGLLNDLLRGFHSERSLDTWKDVTLGQCLKRLYRYPTYFGIKYVEQGVPEVRGELIRAGGRLEDRRELYRRVSRTTAERFPQVRLEPDDFVISVRGTLGKIAVVPEFLRGAVITANLMRVQFDPAKVSPRWARHFLLSAVFQDALNRAASGTTIKTIRACQLRAIRLRLPAMDEQLRIAEILEAHDDRIRVERACLEKLRRQQSGLLSDLI